MAPRIRLAYFFSIRCRGPIIGEWCAVRSTSNWEVGLVPRPMCFTGSGYNFPLLISRKLLIWRFWSCWQWACRISLLYQCILLHNSSFPSASLDKKQIVIVPGFLVFHVALDALPMQLQMTWLPTIKTQTGPIWEVQWSWHFYLLDSVKNVKHAEVHIMNVYITLKGASYFSLYKFCAHA